MQIHHGHAKRLYECKRSAHESVMLYHREHSKPQMLRLWQMCKVRVADGLFEVIGAVQRKVLRGSSLTATSLSALALRKGHRERDGLDLECRPWCGSRLRSSGNDVRLRRDADRARSDQVTHSTAGAQVTVS
ncbi:MAG: hypothetical protein ACOC1F_08130 [Myxococcota bacterium]